METFLPHLEIIDQEFEETFELLKSWVEINSWSENSEGLHDMAAKLKAAFSPLDDHTEEIFLPPVKRIELYSTSTVPLGKALSITKRPHAKKKVLFGGHMDTVFPPSSPFQTWQKVNGDQLVGPGVADMKGGLAILLLGLRAFEKSPLANALGWEVFINPDEEIGSPGSKKFFVERAPLYNIGILFEPSFSDGAIVSQRKGSANFTIVAKGKAAHVGRDFHLGKSAVTALARFIVQIENLQYATTGLTINVGHIHGGGPLNIVPDCALCKINVRFNSDVDLFLVEQKFNEFAKPEHIEIHKDTLRPPKLLDEKTQILYQQFKECASLLDQQLFMRPTGGVCDGNILAQAGLPNLDTMGAIGGNIHTHEEYIFIDSIRERAKLLALFLMNYANQGF